MDMLKFCGLVNKVLVEEASAKPRSDNAGMSIPNLSLAPFGKINRRSVEGKRHGLQPEFA